MLIPKILVASALSIAMLAATGQPARQSVLLPSGEAKNLKFFGLPGKVTGHWNPQEADIKALETNLAQIATLDSKRMGSSFHIEHPETFYRQYLGVSLDYRKLVFVDAFCDLKGLDYWQQHLVIVSDGATCFWHALYDPASGKFTYLDINARG